MECREDHTAVETERIIKKVTSGEYSPSEGIQQLLKVSFRAETVKDLNFIHRVREGFERMVESMGSPEATPPEGS